VGRKAALVVAIATVAALLLQPHATAARAAVASANQATFTYDRLHPERTVVGSAISYTRVPGQPLVLTVSVVPNGRTATFTAVLSNVSGSTLSFGRSGVRVDGMVVRDGRSRATWSLRAPAVTSLAPGARRTVTGVFPLGPAGQYTVSAIARY